MFHNTRNVAIAVLALALIVGFFVGGPILDQLPVGLLTIRQLLWKLIAVVLSVAVLGFVWARHTVRSREPDPDRREFLTGAGVGAGVALGALFSGVAGAAAKGLFGVGSNGRGWASIAPINADVQYTDPEWKEEWKGSRIAAHRRFGRTNWNISDIVLGTGRIKRRDGEKIARLAIDRGVNYFDTSPDYSDAGSEETMGRAIKGVRDKLFIATKFCTPVGHLPAGTPVAEYKAVVEGSLKRLGTDYVDLVHIHSCNEIARLMDENVHEAFDRLKQDGKVRFLGFSSHTPNLEEVANVSIDSGRFDVMMLAYHHGIWPNQMEIIARARRDQDMGIIAMKTLKGAKHRGLEEMRPEADSYSQAALKWVLANDDVSAAVISFFEMQHVDEFVYASGKKLTDRDIALLDKYDRLTEGTYCAPNCGACLNSCSEQLAVNDILRHRMYYEDYGWKSEGIRQYARLGKNASACLGCDAPCAGSCPLGLAIQDRLIGAHEMLTG